MNKKTVKIIGYSDVMKFRIWGEETTEEYRAIQLDKTLRLLVHMRTARKIGDIETINHTVLGRLRDSQIKFEILDGK